MNNYQCISKNHEVLKIVKHLKKSSKPRNYYLVEDLSILELVISTKLPIEYFIFCNERTYQEQTLKLLNCCLEITKNAYAISNRTFESLESKENAIGFIAVIKKELIDNLEKAQKSLQGDLILVLDKLENPGNVGTLLRTADACRIKTIINVDSVVNINNYKLIQSSRGMVLTQTIIELPYEEASKLLLANNYTLYLGEPDLGKPYLSYDYQGPTAIVIGSERFGINPKWYNLPHQKVYIPMYGKMTSLNVGVAGSILMYEAKMKKENIR